MKFELSALPYDYASLEPFMDEATMRLHHDKHHAAYVSKLNEALALHPEMPESSLEDLLKNLASVPAAIRAAVQNHGGGHYNHALFWDSMDPPVAGSGPAGKLLASIERDFGSTAQFKEAFTKAAAGVFGSGWAWLVCDPSQKLSILPTANQICPLSQGLTPLLPLDVWEHAYYLKFQNKRTEYIDSWWNVVSWKNVSKRFEAQ